MKTSSVRRATSESTSADSQVAREEAKIFLTGLHGAAVEAVAKDIVAAGGSAESAEVDALDEQANRQTFTVRDR